MDLSKIIDLETISLKESNEINEKYIQEYIANDPSVLGLGELILKDKERIQPNAGRLDLLLYDSESNRRYEVELQLGKTDESHIIRTIEYWDIERRRYPQYDHCAVIIAEDITSRFLNVIQLFNGNIPLIAIKMTAYKINDKYAIKFTKILDELKLAIEEDEEDLIPTDRSYWESRSTKEAMTIVDDVLLILQEIDQNISVKFNKHYIGLTKSGIAFNFAVMHAKKKFVRLDFKLEQSEEVNKLIDDNGLDVLEYSIRSNRYKIRINKSDVQSKKEIIKELLGKSFIYFG